MTTDLSFAGVIGQAEAVANGCVTSVDLVRAALARIESLDPSLNAFSEVLASHSLAEAAERDGAAASGRGPLHGVPIAVKQELDVAGSVTTFGGVANTTPAAADCAVVQRLRDAGAVILGKTTMPEFGQWPFTESVSTGITRNPWQLDRSTGGSSGGTAAAVAAGLVAGGIGGDGGGSIRIPSACCGLFGLKPSRGRVSTAPHPHLWWSLGTAGALTRTVADSALLLDVISGSVDSDLFQTPPPEESFSDAAAREPGRLRIGWSVKSPTRGVRPSGDSVNSVKVTARRLEALGHDVREIDPHYPDVTAAFVPQFLGGVRAEAAMVDHPHRLERRTKEVIHLGSWVRQPVIDWAVKESERLGRKVNRIFDDVDVLLTPTLRDVPPRVPVLGGAHAPRAMLKSTLMIAWTAIWNVAGNPAAAIPFGFRDDGLPLSVQLVGRPYDEGTLFALAAQLEVAHPWAGRTPSLSV